MALVKELVEVHKGQIEVASEPGQGTTFKISLPLKTAEETLTTLSSLAKRNLKYESSQILGFYKKHYY